jgi:phospholipid/cholesterol/gamma-HCH transport system substrate-binding protein
MASKASGVRLGIFIFLAVAALIVGIFVVGSTKGLFKSAFTVITYFETVEGLRAGAAVRLSGVDVGNVDDVSISAKNNKVQVVLKLRSEIKDFIKTDSQASIETEGLEGESVKDGDIIKSKEPFRLAVVLEEAQGTIANIRSITGDFEQMLAKVNSGKGTLGKLVNDPSVYRDLQRTTAAADSGLRAATEQFTTLSKLTAGMAGSVTSLVSRVDSVILGFKDVVDRVNAGEGAVGALLSDKRLYDSVLVVVSDAVGMMRDARIGASRFAENMEALKHNWLLRGYFEDRGYWDKEQYEKGLDAKLDSLKRKEEELKTLEERLRKKEEELGKKNFR